ncbi:MULTISPECIES: phage terminase small subunit P27 family [unclassified Herbaspirillum]|uniref:phage terminase small subunit P27 family n=1 Tax=unclassified Herbaspirillum TaxID=2624150 RepID=UPI000E2E8BD1|nr:MULTISPECIES: phage terminase small subunit P27 family [unclassified Herbaspirillum]RFB73832.1 phage terminase small subunit P27 family [Herbaspirillum sp. 3R-3a1]TFI10357.1 phage terminase small subunit P27 family [Herbaspirillum sp. 3R11]TFI16261.1 phage terminase small subunit P27 family [Herbaspirillum sp. 3R-11]TFI28358.1 phage terminase small subunit P27 family [Herbaspirillum sp. 3C11]
MTMGQRGPQPQANVLKLMRGNPGKRPINLADGVNPEVAVPDAPRHLNKEARKEWKRITVELEKLGLISRLDRAALALYCQSWGRLVELETAFARRQEMLAEKSEDPTAAYIDVAPSGYRAHAVEINIIRSLQDEVHKFLQSFGLSPSSRSRVTPSTNQMALPGMEGQTGWGQFSK